MSAGNPDWLADMTDAEMLGLAQELESRAEQFTAETRVLINDELRRRKLPQLGFGTSRH